MSNDSLKKAIQKLILLAKKKVVQNQSVKFDMSNDVKALIENKLGKDIGDFTFQIDVYAIKHIFKKHGDEKKEALRGQIAVQDDDLLLLVDVLREPDMVFDSGKNKLGKDTLTFIKYFEEKYVVVKEIRQGRKTIALNSMWIFKTKRTKFP